MTNYDLLKALGSLDAKYEAEAQQRADRENVSARELPVPQPEQDVSAGRKPIYRIMTGVAAAAVFLGVFASVGYVFRKMNPERIQQPGSSELTESLNESVSENSTPENVISTEPNVFDGFGKIIVHSPNLMEDDRFWYVNKERLVEKKKPGSGDAVESCSICTMQDCGHSDESGDIEQLQNCHVMQLKGWKYYVSQDALYEADAQMHTVYEIDGIGGRTEAVSVTREQAEALITLNEAEDYGVIRVQKLADQLYLIKVAMIYPDSLGSMSFMSPYGENADCLYYADTKHLVKLTPDETEPEHYDLNYDRDFYFADDQLLCTYLYINSDETERRDRAVVYQINTAHDAAKPTEINYDRHDNKLIGALEGEDGLTAVYEVWSFSSYIPDEHGVIRTAYFSVMDRPGESDAQYRIADGRLLRIEGNEVTVYDIHPDGSAGRFETGQYTLNQKWDSEDNDAISWEASDLQHILIAPHYAYDGTVCVIFNAETGEKTVATMNPLEGQFTVHAEPRPIDVKPTGLKVEFQFYEENDRLIRAYWNPVLTQDNKPVSMLSSVTETPVLPCTEISLNGNHTIQYDWTKYYGALPDGVYQAEIYLLPADTQDEPDFRSGCSETQEVLGVEFTIGQLSDSTEPGIYVRATEGHADALKVLWDFQNWENRTIRISWDGRIYDEDGNAMACLDGKDHSAAAAEFTLSQEDDKKQEISWKDVYDLSPGQYSIRVVYFSDADAVTPDAGDLCEMDITFTVQ